MGKPFRFDQRNFWQTAFEAYAKLCGVEISSKGRGVAEVLSELRFGSFIEFLR
jgi:hypothetical protein